MTNILYLEIKQMLYGTEEIELQPQMIRIEVVDEQDAYSKATELKNIISGDKKYFLHNHYSSVDGNNQPCSLIELDKSIIEENI